MSQIYLIAYHSTPRSDFKRGQFSDPIDKLAHLRSISSALTRASSLVAKRARA